MNLNRKNLGDLVDPEKYRDPISINGYDSNLLMSMLETMLLIRGVEEKLAECKKNDLIGGPVHLGAGQEAMAVGVSNNLVDSDRVFGTHRSHAHLLALDPCIHGVFAEILGKKTGVSKGMGGSMHLIKPDSGFMGSVPIIAATIPLAVGASFDAKRRGIDGIGVSYLGDGAVEEGIFHESLNLSKILCTPTLFVVENNLFSSHMHISLRQPSDTIARFAEANDIEYKIVDGNNVIEVTEASKYLIKGCRNGEGPKLLEGVTFRQFGHVDWRKDIDVGVNRSEKNLLSWKKRDPIDRLYLSFLQAKIITENQYQKLNQEIKDKINHSWDKAMNDPYPEEEELIKPVYK